MNEQERTKRKKTRRLGKWQYVLKFATGMALTFLVLNAVVGSGCTVLLKQGGWQLHIQQLNWKRLMWQGFSVGASIAYFSWHRSELAHKNDADD